MLSPWKGWQCCDPPASDFQKNWVQANAWFGVLRDHACFSVDDDVFRQLWCCLRNRWWFLFRELNGVFFVLVAILGNILPFFLVMHDGLPVSSIQWPSGLSFLRLPGIFIKNIVMKCSYTLTFRLKCLGCSCCINQLSGVGLFCCLILQWCHNTEFWTALCIAMATDWCHTLKDMTSVHDHAEAQSDLWRRKLTNAHLKSKQGECRLQLANQGASVCKFPT